MKKEEAKKLLNTRVLAKTPMRGSYVGNLIEVVENRPWRGKVKITGVVDYPVLQEGAMRSHRKCKEIGDIIEVGGVNIEPTTETGYSPKEALRKKILHYVQLRENVQVLEDAKDFLLKKEIDLLLEEGDNSDLEEKIKSFVPWITIKRIKKLIEDRNVILELDEKIENYQYTYGPVIFHLKNGVLLEFDSENDLEYQLHLEGVVVLVKKSKII